MYDGRVTRESVIEATSFAAQTITTVGYGNWETPARSLGAALPPNQGERVLRMRMWSVPIMLAGATLYAILIGLWVALMLN